MAAISAVENKTIPLSRDTLKAQRRRELIESTMESIAKCGFSETTLAKVAKGAGLSRGLVNFHFQSKDALLIETLQYISREYRNHWQRALEASPDDAVAQLVAIFRADFDPYICNPRNIAVWFAFWGEAKSRPVYSELCGGRDDERNLQTLRLCETIIEAGGYDLPAKQIARGLESTAEGLWQSLLMPHRVFDRTFALDTMHRYLSLTFPRHIAPDGSVVTPVQSPETDKVQDNKKR